MQAMIDELAKQAAESLGQVSSKETLASFWQEYLSKNGKIPALMKNLRTVAPEERPAMGKIINELKQKVQADYDAAAETVKQAELAARNAAETVDITLPARDSFWFHRLPAAPSRRNSGAKNRPLRV